VRIIAATNADINAAVETGALRRDLYYRLNVIRLHLPPLRERRGDVAQLALYFLRKYAESYRKQTVNFSEEAMRALTLGAWPGNVRELEHVVERAVALSEGPIIQASDLDMPETAESEQLTFRQAKLKFVAQFEQAYIHDLLRLHKGNISQAARAAEKNRRSFWGLIRKYKINANAFRNAASAK
jgi:DNA-binding NtrC family response regulator